MIKRLFLALILLLGTTAAFADAIPEMIEDGSDVVLYEAQRNQTITIGGNHDSGFSINISMGDGEIETYDVGDSLTTNYRLQGVVYRTDQDLTVTYYGSGINALDGSNSFSEFVKAGAYNWPFYELSRIRFSNNSGADVSIQVYVRAIRNKEVQPS